ncbi:hypothetical protein QJS10_CPA01g02325 [Acorus calamus]|uniref:Uncharacterized protein n=1 Tax=Acorus calamus TaxID=4465 RepID=A0AAV9FP70_ACOCL|nr:hypothetical protein QJS10_CPA01g02325 [Acorus calamus]
MGCCFSKKKDRRIPADAPPPPESEANAPPVEETVKEVLSETPKLSSAPPPRDCVKRSAAVLISDERSDDASEICSLSESVSTAATMTTEKAEELERFREWRAERRSASPAKAQRKRSLSGEFPGGMRRDRGGGGGGRYSPSPSRRAEKPLSGREAVQAARSRGGGAVVAANGVRRDPGERSGRRSASPANGRAAADPKGLGRSSSSRRGMASPRRAPLPEPEDGGWGVEKAAFPAAANELLENPLVSLECFIFL